MTASREVSYVAVYELLSPMLTPPSLVAGTPAWCELNDSDPAKWQAVLWAAVWWAVDQDARQEAQIEASHTISAAADWSAIAQRTRNGRGAAYIKREGAA